MARTLLAEADRPRRPVQRGGDRLAAHRLADPGADRAAARILARRRHRRRDHPGALALPVQPARTTTRCAPSSRRCSTPTASARPRARSSSSTPPTSATASRGSSSARDHRRRHPRLGLPADALPGDRDRRPEDRPPRGLLGRRLHRQPGALPAVLPHQGDRHRHRPHQPALPRRAAAHLVGNHHADQRDQLQCFAAARAPQHRLRQPADRPRRHRAGRRCATTTSTRSATTG